jgi:hypothetical protein
MAATFLVFIVLGVGAVAFLVRFFIALGMELGNRHLSGVSRVSPAARNNIPLGTASGNGTNGRRVFAIDEHRNRRIVSTVNMPRRRTIR